MVDDDMGENGEGSMEMEGDDDVEEDQSNGGRR